MKFDTKNNVHKYYHIALGHMAFISDHVDQGYRTTCIKACLKKTPGKRVLQLLKLPKDPFKKEEICGTVYKISWAEVVKQA